MELTGICFFNYFFVTHTIMMGSHSQGDVTLTLYQVFFPFDHFFKNIIFFHRHQKLGPLWGFYTGEWVEEIHLLRMVCLKLIWTETKTTACGVERAQTSQTICFGPDSGMDCLRKSLTSQPHYSYLHSEGLVLMLKFLFSPMLCFFGG